MATVSSIIERWPSAEHFASDIGLKYPSYGRVLKMRGRIPVKYWEAALAAARIRKIELSRGELEVAHQGAPGAIEFTPAPAEPAL